MTRVVVMLLVIASAAHADGLPYGNGPCDDADACEQACATDTAACLWGGHYLLRSGLDVPQHRARAGKLYAKACARGDAEGCWRAGLTADRSKARAFYDMACTRKLVRACLSLANLDGAPGDARAHELADADHERALAIETAACRNKDAAACERALSLLTVTMSRRDDKRIARLEDLRCIARTGAPCPPPPKCDDATVAQKAQQAATAATERSFADALANEHLQPVTLAQKTFNRFSGYPFELKPGQKWAPDQVVDVRIGGRGWQHVLVGFDTWSRCAAGPGRNEYAQRGDRIYRIERAPRVVSTESFAVCSCGPTCGGATPARLSTSFELPPGTTFGGTLAVPYDEERVVFQYMMQCAPPP